MEDVEMPDRLVSPERLQVGVAQPIRCPHAGAPRQRLKQGGLPRRGSAAAPHERAPTPPRNLCPRRRARRPQALLEAQAPRYVPLEGSAGDALPPTDGATGITQRRLSNGIRINYRWGPGGWGQGFLEGHSTRGR
jgi:hypothetical protein